MIPDKNLERSIRSDHVTLLCVKQNKKKTNHTDSGIKIFNKYITSIIPCIKFGITIGSDVSAGINHTGGGAAIVDSDDRRNLNPSPVISARKHETPQ